MNVIAASWRPDGRQIAFSGWLDPQEGWPTRGLYVADADGTDVRELPIG